MAPDDLKFMRMEARLQEQQQQAMAELDLGQLVRVNAKRDSQEAIARAGPKETLERQDKMNFLIGGAPSKGPKLLVNGKELQKYGACEWTTKTSKALTSTSDNLEEAGGQFMGPKGPARPQQSAATIGGNKLAHLEGKFRNEELEAIADKRDLLVESKAKGRQSFGDQNKGDSDGTDGGEEPKLCIIQRLAKVVPCFGIILALCASCCLGTAGMLVKLIESVHGIEVAVIRALIQMTIYAGVICCRQQRRWLPARNELFPVMSRALFGGTSITFSYYALKLIPLGDATTIRFSLPIWTLIMGYFFLHESCSFYKILAVLISISGVILVTKPDDCIQLINWLALVLFNYNTSGHSSSPSNWPTGTNKTFLLNNGGELLANVNESQSQQDIEEIAMLVESPPPLSLNPLGASSLEDPSSRWQNANASGQQKQQRNHQDVVQVVQIPLVGVRPVPSDPLRQLEGCSMALASSVCLALSIIALRMCKQTPFDVTILRPYSALLLGEQIRGTSIIGSVLVSLGVIIVMVPRWFNCSASDGPNDDQDDEDGQRSRASNDSTPPQTDTTSESDSAAS